MDELLDIRPWPPNGIMARMYPVSKRLLKRKMLEEALTHERITKEAHKIWIEDGCPDGEQLTANGRKLKDLHWAIARTNIELFSDIDCDFLWHFLFTGEQPHSVTIRELQ